MGINRVNNSNCRPFSNLCQTHPVFLLIMAGVILLFIPHHHLRVFCSFLELTGQRMYLFFSLFLLTVSVPAVFHVDTGTMPVKHNKGASCSHLPYLAMGVFVLLYFWCRVLWESVSGTEMEASDEQRLRLKVTAALYLNQALGSLWCHKGYGKRSETSENPLQGRCLLLLCSKRRR